MVLTGVMAIAIFQRNVKNMLKFGCKICENLSEKMHAARRAHTLFKKRKKNKICLLNRVCLKNNFVPDIKIIVSPNRVCLNKKER